MSLSQALNQFAQNLGRYPDNSLYTAPHGTYPVAHDRIYSLVCCYAQQQNPLAVPRHVRVMASR